MYQVRDVATLLRLLGALDRPSEGVVAFEGCDLATLLSAVQNGNLDSATGADVIELLAGLAAMHGATVVVATRDAELAAWTPKRLVLRDGKILRPVSAVA
jgi:ABC-type lipoprotein export system ATPase subunit